MSLRHFSSLCELLVMLYKNEWQRIDEEGKGADFSTTPGKMVKERRMMGNWHKQTKKEEKKTLLVLRPESQLCYKSISLYMMLCETQDIDSKPTYSNQTVLLSCYLVLIYN